MGFNCAQEKAKFDREWLRLRKEYTDAGTHPSKSSFGKLSRNDLVRGQWYSCPATASRNGGSSERSSEGCKTRARRQPPFSRCLGSGKKRRTGASIKISKAGAALRKQSRPVVKGERYESEH